jgi:hypothetical protein
VHSSLTFKLIDVAGVNVNKCENHETWKSSVFQVKTSSREATWCGASFKAKSESVSSRLIKRLNGDQWLDLVRFIERWRGQGGSRRNIQMGPSRSDWFIHRRLVRLHAWKWVAPVSWCASGASDGGKRKWLPLIYRYSISSMSSYF